MLSVKASFPAVLYSNALKTVLKYQAIEFSSSDQLIGNMFASICCRLLCNWELCLPHGLSETINVHACAYTDWQEVNVRVFVHVPLAHVHEAHRVLIKLWAQQTATGYAHKVESYTKICWGRWSYLVAEREEGEKGQSSDDHYEMKRIWDKAKWYA